MTSPYDAERIRAALARWRERLLDLSRANPLLSLNRSRVTKLRVSEPPPAILFERFVVRESVLRMPLVRKRSARRSEGADVLEQEEPQWELEAGDIGFDAPLSELGRRIKRTYDNARTTVEERGVTTLHLTFGTLHWSDPTLGESQSPLWMVPCELESTGLTTALRLKRADEEAQINPALDLFLRDRHKIQLPALPDEPSTDVLGEFLQGVRHAVAEPGWVVDDSVWLSTFSFESLAIYRDLEQMEEEAVQHELVAALARAGAEPQGSEALGGDLDELSPQSTPLTVMPTDSSQLEALTHATSGRHVVVHGPPGTGKSQTITALIADAIGRGKTVLFVSAKMAALEIVSQRLGKLGLSRFCLEAHSTKAGKAKVIDELRRTLETDDDAPDSVFEDDLEALRRVRAQLTAYVRELHERREPLGLTVYRGIGKVAKLSAAPELRFTLPWEDPLAVTRDLLNDVLDALAELSAQASVFDARATHPWRGFAGSGGVREREAIEVDLRLVREGLEVIRRALGDLLILLPRGETLSLEELKQAETGLEAFSSITCLPSNWRDRAVEILRAEADLFERAAALANELAEAKASLLEAFTIGPDEIVALLLPLRAQYSHWYERFTPAYFRWRSEERRQLRPGIASDRSALAAYLQQAERCSALRNEVEVLRPHLSREVGEAVADAAELAAVAHQYRTAELLRTSSVMTGDVQQPTEETRAAARRLRDALPSHRPELSAALERIDAAWPDGLTSDRNVAQASLEALASRVAEILAAIAKIDEWVFLRRTIAHCKSLSLGPLIDAIGTVSAVQAQDVFQRRFYALWTSTAIDGSDVLSRSLGGNREELIRRFRDLDEKIRLSAVRHVRAMASQSARLVRAADPAVGTAGQVGILRVELVKRRRLKPLRRLFGEIPQVLQALKPCMLMSPISVSTFLKPGSLRFDLVVFDEASQLPTPEAIPSILRAKQVVVAGDRNQLPPTNFFTAQLLAAEEEFDEEAYAQEQLESLLDECDALVPHFQNCPLRWHYRSRDERLIKFSNHYFYENRLHTFPSPSMSSEGRGVRLVYVADGVWGRGRDRKNPREARRVAQIVIELLERYPDRSIGVVAMNISQREAIDDAVREELLSRPDLVPLWTRGGEEAHFVKALENVQGDERDLMVISVGYGKDLNGGFTANFGPLNMEGGWRRLNVLVTRAKWQTILVTSMRANELDGINPNNRGAVALRDYIAYAERNGELPPQRVRSTDAETNDFEDAVCEALRDRGLDVDQQVGAGPFRIDLAIRDRGDPRRYILGVECDGASYHASRTARDRDVARHQVLRSMGWRLHHLWSTDWFRDPASAVVSILRSLQQAEATQSDEMVEAPARAPAAARREADPPRPEPEPVPPTPTGQPYVRYQYSGYPRRDYLMMAAWQTSLAENVRAIVDVEGPILPELLLERLKEIHRVGRAGDNVRNNVRAALGRAMRSGEVIGQEDDGDLVLRSPRTELSTFRTPGDGVHRTIEQIPREEVALAVIHLVKTQFGMLRERIPSAVTTLFGFDRSGAVSQDRIREVVDRLVEQGRLRPSGPYVTVP